MFGSVVSVLGRDLETLLPTAPFKGPSHVSALSNGQSTSVRQRILGVSSGPGVQCTRFETSVQVQATPPFHQSCPIPPVLPLTLAHARCSCGTVSPTGLPHLRACFADAQADWSETETPAPAGTNASQGPLGKTHMGMHKGAKGGAKQLELNWQSLLQRSCWHNPMTTSATGKFSMQGFSSSTKSWRLTKSLGFFGFPPLHWRCLT